MLRPALVSTLALGLAIAGCSRSEAPATTSPTNTESTSLDTESTASETDTVQPAAMSVREVGTPEQSILDLYLQLHQAPELSFKEAKTSSILASELETLGFEVTTSVGQDWVVDKATRDIGEVKAGVGGYGVVGVLRNGNGPTVLIRTDMDALPVPEQTGVPYASAVEAQTWTGVESKVMHACGHDVHMTSWLATARALVAQKSKWKGTLVMIAQPAEEIGLGAEAMLADGLFERFPKPDYNLALHVSADAPSGTWSIPRAMPWPMSTAWTSM
jgi:amidohydrolase